MKRIDLRTVFAGMAVILAVFALIYMFQYKEELAESPCEICIERGFTCNPRMDLYGDCIKNGTVWLCKTQGASYYDQMRDNMNEEANK